MRDTSRTASEPASFTYAKRITVTFWQFLTRTGPHQTLQPGPYASDRGHDLASLSNTKFPPAR